MGQPMAPTHISQIAMVVHDLDATMKHLNETLGWGPWNVYEHVPPKLHHTHLRGEEVAFSMLGAECEVQPGIVFELVEHLAGPIIYKEHLEKYGEGVQHIACMMHSQADSDEFKKDWVARGAMVLMGGRIGETIEFYYLDTEPMLKFVLESGSGHAIDLTPSRVYPPA
ncbi:MAG: methylmalonyl-CoA/ethylmalonyl-CoA epimerase [Chloroflexota bacterium]|nr:methylmalonyl-CoA/ethylmalonyl-CoA epimerase [Chloroflexota bacterium]